MKKNIFHITLFTALVMLFANIELAFCDPPTPKSEKRFTLLKKKQTNIDFNNKIEDTKDHNILIYSNYYGGAGVAAGDFNNDGLQDLFFAGNLVADRLFLNTGNLEFKDITKSANIADNGGWSSGLALADVNNDGYIDIYVCRELYDESPELRKNKLYINNRDLTFTESAEQYKIADDARSRHAVFFDYDKDGDSDLFVLNQPPNPGSYSPLSGSDLTKPEFSPKLYRNDGSYFADVTKSAGLLRTGFPNSVSACDFDKDGWVDLFVANDFDAPDFYYHNNGDGSFTNILESSMRHISYYSMGVDAGDINNDGLLDIMVADMVAEDNYRLKANMGGMDPKSFWKVYNKGGHYQYMFNSLHLNQGQNVYSDIAQLSGASSTDWSWSNLIVDLDNDGYKDLHVTNGLLRDIRNSDASKKVSQEIFKKVEQYYSANPGQSNMSVFDIIDLDEILNVVPSQKLSNYVFKNINGLTFEKMMGDWGMDQKTFSNGSAVADLDNDGDLEVIVNNINEESYIYKNNSELFEATNYIRIKPVRKNGMAMSGAKVQIEADGNKQYAELTTTRGIYSVSEPVVHFGLGNASNVDKVIVTWPDNTKTVLENIVANQTLIIAPENKKDLISEKRIGYFTAVEIDELSRKKHLENSFDDYRHQVLLPHKLSQEGPALDVGDVNGDGLQDVFLGGSVGLAGKILVQTSQGKFYESKQPAIAAHSRREDVDATFFDIDQDGDQDLLVLSGGNEFEVGNENYKDRLYLNDGKGNFIYDENRFSSHAYSSSVVRTCDVDLDGDIDIFIGSRFIPRDYPSPASSTIYINENGTLSDRTDQLAPELMDLGLVTDATWSDINGDTKPDLVIVGEWMPITIFENLNNKLVKTTTPNGLEEEIGWWYGLESADIDNDGDQDLIAGNLGLNYKYKATKKEPFEVHYDDFDDNGSKDIVLSYYNFGEQFPLRGRSCSAEQVPTIKQKFPSYDLFASSSLDDIYGVSSLKKALHIKATNFASGYIENLGNGQFEFNQLPLEAQVSSINDIMVSDINRDGNKDLIIAGNLYGAEVETTRNDAGIGLLLLGDGNGGFEPISALNSGLYADSDIKNINSISISGRDLIIMGANNDYPKIFEIIK